MKVLERYAARKVSRVAAAETLAVSERQVNRLMEDRGLERVKAVSKERKEEAEKKRIARTAAARLAKGGKLSPELAARRAGCSMRTIYRYMAKIT